MQRGTQTTAAALQVGDRFYKVTDIKKAVCEMVYHKPKMTRHRTYSLWCLPPNTDARYPKEINSTTEVIFLRHNND